MRYMVTMLAFLLLGLGAVQGLDTERDPAVGTLWRAGARKMDATPYAAAKLAGERMCRTLARRSTLLFGQDP